MNLNVLIAIIVAKNGPEPLPLVILASLFLLTSWIMRRVGAKN